MKNIIDWIEKHKLLTAIAVFMLFFLPLIIVNILFKWHSSISWLKAEWGAGDLLNYIAGFEALLGTVVLGAVTVYQSDRANEVNERLSKENNYLQKISIQQMLPLIKVTELTIRKTRSIDRQLNSDNNSVLVSNWTTAEKSEPHIEVYPQLQNNGQSYHKRVEISFENISAGPISQISIDRIEFPGFNFKNNYVEKTFCVGVEKAKYISQLILPGDRLNAIVDIYFDNELFKKFWEFDEMTSIGNFNMSLYLTNRSISGIDYKEKIYIEKGVGFKETIMYKAYEEETGNA